MRDDYFTRPVGSTVNELSVKTENSQSDSDDQQSVVAAQVDIKVRKRKKWRMDYTEPVKEIPSVVLETIILIFILFFVFLYFFIFFCFFSLCLCVFKLMPCPCYGNILCRLDYLSNR